MKYYRYAAPYDILRLEEYDVIKTTPCGVWISVYSVKKFILTHAKKKYANPTKGEALEAYYARKRCQIKILEANLERAKRHLTLTPENPSDSVFDLF